MLDEPEATTPETPQRLRRCCSWWSEQHRTVWRCLWSSDTCLQKKKKQHVRERLNVRLMLGAWSLGSQKNYIYLCWLDLKEKRKSFFWSVWLWVSLYYKICSFWGRTVDTYDPIRTLHRSIPSEEFDGAGEIRAFRKPLSEPDRQPTGDFVVLPCLLGSVVGRYTICDFYSVNQPEHIHMVRVETIDQTHQGLLLVCLAFSFTLFFWRFQHFHLGQGDSVVWIWGDKGNKSSDTSDKAADFGAKS